MPRPTSDPVTTEIERLKRRVLWAERAGEERWRRNCGIYGVRPFACRIYFNIAQSRHSCQNPDGAMLQTLKPYLEKILGPYRGGYRP